MLRKKSSHIIRVAWDAFMRFRGQIVFLIGLGFFSSIFEAVGVNALIPVFAIVSGSSTGTQLDRVSVFIRQLFAYVGIDFRIRYLLLLICVLFVFKAIVQVVATYMKFKLTYDYEHRIRNELLKKTLEARWPYLVKQKVGYLESIMSNDGHLAGLFSQHVSNFLLVCASLIVYVVAAFNIAFTATAVSLMVGIVIFVIFRPLIRLKRLFAREMIKMKKHAAHFVNEHIIGMKVVKSLSVIDGVTKRGATYFMTLRDLGLKSVFYSTIATAALQPISFIFLIILFAIMYQKPGFQIGAFAVIVYLIQRIFSYIEQLQSSIHKISDTFPFLESILSYDQTTVNEREQDTGLKPFVFQHEFRFDHVTFGYDTDKTILSDISFVVPNGSMIGMIGSSGGGKTTVVDLMLRLLRPSHGSILLDGVSVDDITLAAWRKNVGYVSQDIFLFNDTIEQNIRMYDDTLTEDDIIHAAKMADIYDFVQQLPEGFRTSVGERGARLSVGQRQRVALARILVRKPSLLILDEATSSLDNESETRIQKVIEQLKGQITIFLIAHRLSTVMNCDTLLVLDNGKITEQGSPETLLKDPTSYFSKVRHVKE